MTEQPQRTLQYQLQSEFMACCLRGDLKQVKQLYSKSVHSTVSKTAILLLMSACYQERRDVISFMLSAQLADNKTTHCSNEEDWARVTSNFHVFRQFEIAKNTSRTPDAASLMQVAKWLLSLKSCDISSKGVDYAFVAACCGGHLELAQWLFQSMDISLMGFNTQQQLLQIACDGGLDVAYWVFDVLPTNPNRLQVISLGIYEFAKLSAACDTRGLKIAHWLYTFRSKSTPASKKHESLEACAFQEACAKNDLPLAQWMFLVNPALSIGLSCAHEFVFRNTCAYGRLEMAKWMFSINPSINLSHSDHAAFRGSCHAGQMTTDSCPAGRIAIAQWFVSMDPFLYEIELNAEGTQIINYRVRAEEDARWQKRKVALWMRSNLATNRTIFNRLSDDVSRWIVEYI